MKTGTIQRSNIIPRPKSVKFDVVDPANGCWLGGAEFSYCFQDSVTGWYRSLIETFTEWGVMIAKHKKHSLGIRIPKVIITFVK